MPGEISDLNETFIDSFFGQYIKDHMELSRELKKIFYYDNAIVQRRESEIFG